MGYPCPICNKRVGGIEELAKHTETQHPNDIPKDMTTRQFLYFQRTGYTRGICMVCKKRNTPWNYETEKPHKICGPTCVKAQRLKASSNYKRVHGVSRGETLSSASYQQNVMLKNQKRNKVYKFPDGAEINTLSSLEIDGLDFMVHTLGFDSTMILECPYIFKYKDGDKVREYIPDLYLPDYNVIIEWKEGGNNPNTNPAYLKETKYKQALKAEAVRKDGKFHYIIVEDNNYEPLVELLDQIKEDKLKKKPGRKKYHIINESITQIEGDVGMSMNLVLFTVSTGDVVEMALMDDPNSGKLIPFMTERDKFEVVDFTDKSISKYRGVKVYNLVPHSSMELLDFWKIMNFEINSGRKIECTYNYVMELLNHVDVGIHVDSNLNNNEDGLMDFGLVFEGESLNGYIKFVKQNTLNENILLNLSSIVGFGLHE